MQELKYFYMYSHRYSLLVGTKVILFFKFTGQIRHFMTRLDALFVPNNILDCHIPDRNHLSNCHIQDKIEVLTAIFRMD